MRLILVCILVGVLGCAGRPVGKASEEAAGVAFDKGAILDHLEHPPQRSLELVGLDQARGRRKEFLELYRDRIWPHHRQRERLEYQQGLLGVLLDAAVFDSDEEKSRWEARAKDLRTALLTLNSDKAWLADVARWADLARGFKGELPDLARRLREDSASEVIRPEAAALLEKLDQVYRRVARADNDSPFNKTYGAAKLATQDVERRWEQGKLSLEQAAAELEKVGRTGPRAMGEDLVARVRGDLDELARLRSRFARAQGFKSWAHYKLVQDAHGYAGELRTVEGRERYLKAYLARTRAAFLKDARERLGTASYGAALVPLLARETDALIQDYFRTGPVEERWRQAMLASGFKAETLAAIHLDTRPRPHRYAAAYQNAVSDPMPGVLRIDARTLSAALSPAEAREPGAGAEIYLLAHTGAGPGPLRLLLHEGAHALDHASRQNFFGIVPAYAYTETPSMMMELFYFSDPAFLRSFGVPEDLVAKYRDNFEHNLRGELREMAAEALIELELWDRDYGAPGAPSYTDRALELYARHMGEATGASFEPRGADWRALAFSENHFYNGKVRRIGYLLATQSAAFTAEALRAKLRARTGRSDFYGQPAFGELLTQGLLRHGFRERFPRSIERFAGRPFKP